MLEELAPHNTLIIKILKKDVVPSRIELESRASETLILSIVLQDQKQGDEPVFDWDGKTT